MGIYDRDYYRRDGGGLIDAFALRGHTTKWLIIVNVAVFIVQLMTRGDHDVGWFTDALKLDPEKVLHGQVWRLVTCAFLHDPFGWTHIFFNMWCLWLFGGDVEDVYGRREFLAFYLAAAVVSSLAFFGERLILNDSASALGASGAVTAVLILCAFHFPNRVILLFMFIPIPIWVFAMFQVAQDTFRLVSGASGVAVAAHLGGAAFAFFYYKRNWRVLNWFSALRSFRLPRSRPRLRIYDEEKPQREPVSVSAAVKTDIDEHFEAKVDAVLEKVTRHGQQSLTDAEKEILLRASEFYKKRRS